MLVEWSDLVDALWALVWIVGYIGYLFVLFSVIADLFRDHAVGGWAKALWVVLLVVLPFPTAVVYLIARGPSMQRRQRDVQRRADHAMEAMVQSHGHPAPASELEQASGLLDRGLITEGEFATLKRHLLTSIEPGGTYGDARQA